MTVIQKVLAFFQKRAIKQVFKNSSEGVLILNKMARVIWVNKMIKERISIKLGDPISSILGEQKYTWPPTIDQPIRRQINQVLIEYIITPVGDDYLLIARHLNGKNGIVSELHKKNARETGQIFHDLAGGNLNAIIGFSDICLEGGLDDATKQEYLNLIYTKANEMDNGIKEYLDLIALEDGVRTINLGLINLKYLADSAKTLVEAGFHKEGIKIQITGTDISIIANDDLIKNALNNALINAAQAAIEIGQDKNIQINISENDDNVIITIINSGHISENNLKKIFTSATFSTKHGNGMGTKAIKFACTAHKGTCKMTCENNQVILTIALPKIQPV